jgi:alpha-tubulin suppressor-like RCC1 family protein
VSGHALIERTVLAPVPIPAQVYLTRVGCADMFTIAVDQDGNVWGAGSNMYSTLSDVSTGTLITLTKRSFTTFPVRPYIIDVAVSTAYTLFLTNNGSVL